MIYYIILAFLLFLAAFSLVLNNRTINTTLFVICVGGLLLFAGLRYNVGFDYINYENIYYLFEFGTGNEIIEPISSLLIHLTIWLHMGYVGFIFLMAFLSLTSKGSFMLKYSYYPLLSLVLYFSRIFITMDFGTIRQGLSLVLVLFSFRYIVEKNLVKFTLLIIIGSLIHTSCALFFPVYFIAARKINIKWITFMILLAIPLATIDLKVFIFKTFAAFLPDVIAARLTIYTVAEFGSTLGITYSAVLRIMVALICIIFFRKQIYADKYALSVFNIYIFGLVFYLIFNSMPQIGNRGSLSFQQFEVLLFPMMMTYIKNPLLKTLLFIFIIFYSFWGLKTTIDSQTDSFIPYKTVLSL